MSTLDTFCGSSMLQVSYMLNFESQKAKPKTIANDKLIIVYD